MTTASGGVAVVALQIARTDRRALSQAWYSALHLARDRASVPARTARRAASPQPALAVPRQRRAADFAERAPHAAAPRAPHAARPRADATGQPPSRDERRIGRAIAALAARPRVAATHTVALDGGRVCLLVRSDGRTTHIVALCSAALREPVVRAVAGARYALAGAGIAVAVP